MKTIYDVRQCKVSATFMISGDAADRMVADLQNGAVIPEFIPETVTIRETRTVKLSYRDPKDCDNVRVR